MIAAPSISGGHQRGAAAGAGRGRANGWRLMLASLAVSLPVLAGCGLKTPEAPSWDVDINVPFAPDTMTVQEIVERTAALQSSSGAVSYHLTSTLPSTLVGSSLTLNRFDAPAVSTTLDTFEITAPAPLSNIVTLSEISPVPVSGQSSSMALPSFAFAADDRAVTLGGSGFQSATVTHAALALTVVNELGLAVDQLSFTLRDPSTGAAILVWTPGTTLASGATLTQTLSLPMAPAQTVSIGPSVLLDVAGHINGGTVTISSNQLRVSGTFVGSIEASAATAQIPAQRFSRTLTSTVQSSGAVTAARFASGTLLLTAQNASPLSGTLDLTVRELTDPATGQPSVTRLTVPAGSSASGSISLAGLNYAASIANQFTVDVTANTVSSTGSVTVQSSDAVTVSATSSGLVLQSATGVLDSTRITIAGQTIEVDVPNGLANVSIPRAKATLTLRTTAQVPGIVQLWVTGYDARDQAFTLAQNGTQLPPVTLALTPGVGGTVVLDETNSNIAAFVSRLPTRIVVSGSAVIGDGHTSGSVSQSDAVSGDLVLEVPVSLAVTAPVTLAGSVETVAISADTRTQLEKRVQSIRLLADISNGLPMGASLTLAVSRTRQGAVDSLAVSGHTVVLHGTVAAASSAPRAPGRTTLDVGMDGADIAILTQPQCFVATYLHLPATPGTVSVFPTDAVVVQARIQARARISQ